MPYPKDPKTNLRSQWHQLSAGLYSESVSCDRIVPDRHTE